MSHTHSAVFFSKNTNQNLFFIVKQFAIDGVYFRKRSLAPLFSVADERDVIAEKKTLLRSTIFFFFFGLLRNTDMNALKLHQTLRIRDTTGSKERVRECVCEGLRVDKKCQTAFRDVKSR